MQADLLPKYFDAIMDALPSPHPISANLLPSLALAKSKALYIIFTGEGIHGASTFLCVGQIVIGLSILPSPLS